MIALLRQYQHKVTFDLEIIDIDDDPILVQRYNELIPVLISTDDDQREICHHYLDIATLDAYFHKIR
ncbi:MAG: glutaredoxin family protein [Nitrosomonas sp.]|nr:glutaredoxin family protein [Nitrosomonas sp.]MBK7364615.1 glutaredoxin family protein [Nitrosomonas sp.]